MTRKPRRRSNGGSIFSITYNPRLCYPSDVAGDDCG